MECCLFPSWLYAVSTSSMPYARSGAYIWVTAGWWRDTPRHRRGGRQEPRVREPPAAAGWRTFAPRSAPAPNSPAYHPTGGADQCANYNLSGGYRRCLWERGGGFRVRGLLGLGFGGLRIFSKRRGSGGVSCGGVRPAQLRRLSSALSSAQLSLAQLSARLTSNLGVVHRFLLVLLAHAVVDGEGHEEHGAEEDEEEDVR